METTKSVVGEQDTRNDNPAKDSSILDNIIPPIDESLYTTEDDDGDPQNPSNSPETPTNPDSDSPSFFGMLAEWEEHQVLPDLEATLEAEGFEFSPENDNPEGFRMALQKYTEARTKKLLDSKLDTPEKKAFYSFIEKGGDPKEFYETYYSEDGLKSYDTSSKEGQITALRDYYKTVKNLEDDEIGELIESMELKGTVETNAGKAAAHLQKQQETKRAELETKKEQERLAAQEAQKREIEEINKKFDALTRAGNVDLTPKMKDQMKSILFSEQGREGLATSLSDLENYSTLALLEQHKDKNGKWDLQALAEKIAGTKVTQKLSSTLNTGKKSLSDYKKR